MSKYSAEFKIRVVQHHLANGGGTRSTAVHFSIDHATVRKWLYAFQLHGPSALSKRPQTYTVDDKLRVLRRMEQENWSTRQTSTFFNIPTPSTVQTWLRRYNEGGAEALTNRRRGRSVSKPKKPKPPQSMPLDSVSPEAMQQELEFLRAENAYLKKLDALVQEKRSASKKKH